MLPSSSDVMSCSPGVLLSAAVVMSCSPGVLPPAADVMSCLSDVLPSAADSVRGQLCQREGPEGADSLDVARGEAPTDRVTLRDKLCNAKLCNAS